MSLPSPPPAKKLQVQQSSSILPQDFPKLEVLPVEKPTKLQERRSPCAVWENLYFRVRSACPHGIIDYLVRSGYTDRTG
uniref:Uncharacterized protein n=1 Tax=Oryza nivara TaxID=4536 RepID=A0A0E0IAR4_ORYNI